MLAILVITVIIPCIFQVILFTNAHKDETSSKLYIDELTVNRIIEERLSKLEITLKAQLDFKLRAVFDEEKTNKEKIRKLENTVKKQQLDLENYKQLETYMILQREEIQDLQNKMKELRSEHLSSIRYHSTVPTRPNDKETYQSRNDSKHTVRADETQFISNEANAMGSGKIETKIGQSIQRDVRLLLGTANPDTPTYVAFYAYLSKSETSSSPHHTIIFDHVETNIGSGYNSHTGAFIVPLDGIYMFFYTFFNARQAYGSYEIVVNSISRGAIFVENSAPSVSVYTGTTGVAVLYLFKGDDCFIRTHSTYKGSGTIRSDNLMRTSFSGVKIGY